MTLLQHLDTKSLINTLHTLAGAKEDQQVLAKVALKTKERLCIYTHTYINIYMHIYIGELDSP